MTPTRKNYRVAPEVPSARRVAVLVLAKGFPTENALKRYLRKHPNADKTKHYVIQQGEQGSPGDDDVPQGEAGPPKEEEPGEEKGAPGEEEKGQEGPVKEEEPKEEGEGKAEKEKEGPPKGKKPKDSPEGKKPSESEEPPESEKPSVPESTPSEAELEEARKNLPTSLPAAKKKSLREQTQARVKGLGARARDMGEKQKSKWKNVGSALKKVSRREPLNPEEKRELVNFAVHTAVMTVVKPVLYAIIPPPPGIALKVAISATLGKLVDKHIGSRFGGTRRGGVDGNAEFDAMLEEATLQALNQTLDEIPDGKEPKKKGKAAGMSRAQYYTNPWERVTAERVASLYLHRKIRATKSKSKREEEEVERMNRSSPSKKPPRQDLRRNRMKEEDKDLENLGADGDRDLSLNYKRVARAFVARCVERTMDQRLASLVLAENEAPSKPPPLKPGEFDNRTPSGRWRAKSPEGVQRSFENKDQAVAYVKGWGTGGEEEEEDPAKKEDAEIDDKVKQEERDAEEDALEELTESLEEETASLEQAREKVRGRLKRALGAADAETRKKALDALELASDEDITAFSKTLASLNRSFPGSDARTRKELRDLSTAALKTPVEDITKEGGELGVYLAALAFAKTKMGNPSLLGGKKVSDEEKGLEALQARTQEALDFYHSASPEIRQEAMDQIAKQMEGVEGPRKAELDAIFQGLYLASSVAGEPMQTSEGEELAPSLGPQFAKLGPSLVASGGIYKLAKMSVEQYFGPEGQKAIQEAVKFMSDDEMQDYFKEGPFSPIADLLTKVNEDEGGEDEGGEDEGKPVLTAQGKEAAREILADLASFELTAGEEFLRAVAEGFEKGMRGSEKVTSPKMQEARKQIREQETSDPQIQEIKDSLLECLDVSGDAQGECLIGGQEALALRRAKIRLDYLENLSEDFAPGHPGIARLRHAIESGDPSILKEMLISQEKARETGKS